MVSLTHLRGELARAKADSDEHSSKARLLESREAICRRLGIRKSLQGLSGSGKRKYSMCQNGIHTTPNYIFNLLIKLYF